jgi:HSP20 family molecular chaperone IbpA
MPGEAVQDGVSAEFRDGVLTIRVPKKEADSRKIMVRSDS